MDTESGVSSENGCASDYMSSLVSVGEKYYVLYVKLEIKCHLKTTYIILTIKCWLKQHDISLLD